MIDTVVKKKYKKIPCRKCISFPICIAIFKEYEIKKDKNEPYFGSTMSYGCISDLAYRCSPIYYYLIEDKIQQDDVSHHRCFKRIEKIYKYFYNRLHEDGG